MTKDPRKATPRDLRFFGVGLGVILSVLGGLAWRKGAPSMPYLFSAAGAFAALGLAAPKALKPVYVPWMKVVGVIGAVNQFLLMTLMFYLVITPYSIALRLLGKDPLDLKMRTGDSYWREHEAVEEMSSYERQF